MSQPVIRVEGLSKQYRIGTSQYGYRTLRDAITNAVTAPVRRLKGGPQAESRHQRVWALKDIDFVVRPGEVVGIIGRNGAGKSTLLKILSRITEPTSGCVALRGRVASLLEVGTGFHPELTGRENIYLNGAILGMRRQEIQKKFDEIVAFADVVRYVDTPVKRYSSGMYLRLAFAVAAHLEPEILVVDEVLAVGDQEFQRRCLGRMKMISTSGRTVLFVSHNMAAVSTLCSRALYLEKGTVRNDGCVGDVIAEYCKSVTFIHPSHLGLADVPRAGTGEARITRFRLLDATGQAVDRIEVGACVGFEVTFTCHDRIRKPAFGIALDTVDGRRVLRVESVEMVGDLPESRRGGTVVCRIDELMITPGPYRVTLNMGNGGPEAVDRLEQCVEFEVLPIDIYGTGRLPAQHSSTLIAKGQWRCEYQ